MGIRVTCPQGHKLHVKTFLAGKRGICPHCGAKFVIPAAQEAQESAESTLRTSRGASPQNRVEAFSHVGRGPAKDVASSPSIIIGLAEPKAAATPSSAVESRVVGTVETAVPLVAPSVDAAATVPTIVAEPAAAAPELKYVAHRQRSRRNQLTIAVALLVAVIVLACVLIWVLRRGSGQSAAAMHHRLTAPQREARPYAAIHYECTC